MTTYPEGLVRSGGSTPARPTDDADAVMRPLSVSAVRIAAGLWADRQRVNREASIPIGSHRLRDAGNLADLELAARQLRDPDANPLPDEYRGPLFMDSDVYKWLEAVAWEYGRVPAEELREEIATFSDAVAQAQADDGYVNSFVQVTRAGAERYRDLVMGHEHYCFGHLIQAAVALHRVIGDCALWQVALRAADHLVATFGPGGNPGLDGHPVVEMALVELYRETGRREYLELAEHFVTTRGRSTIHGWHREPIYFSDRVPVRDAEVPEGHAVRAMYLAAGAGDLALEGTGDLAPALARQWRNMVDTKQYVTGGLGSRWDGEAFGDPYELPPDVAYAETCASIGAVQWAWRQLLRTGEVGYADGIERLLLNGFLSGVSLSGEEFFYVNTLQVRSDAVPDDHRQPVNGRQRWFHTACCPPNVMRTIAQVGSYFAAADDAGLIVHQYADRHDHRRRPPVGLQTDYPWDGRITVTVEETVEQPWQLSLRVPGWCEGATLTGPDGDASPVGPGYVCLQRTWRAGDRVVLELPMPVRLTRAHERVDAVRGCRAIERGPLVYAVEQTDLPAGIAVDDLHLRSADPALLRAEPQPDLLGGCVVVHRPGRGHRRRGGHDPRGAVLPVGQPRGGPDARLAAAGRRRRGELMRRCRAAASVAACLAAVVTTLSACTGAGTLPSPAITGAGFGQHATGTVQLWVRAATQAASAPIVAAFNASHPDLKVNMTAIPDTQYITKLATAIRGRSVPDVVDVDDINSTLLAYHEALTDITPLVDALPYKDQLSPAHLNLATYQGRIYGVPYAADISVLYYNKTLFRRAGLDPSKPPKTLDQVLADARAINKLGGGVSGFSFGGDSPGIMGFTSLPSVWASKNYLFRGPLDAQHADIANNPALRKMLQFYRTVWRDGLSSSSSRTESGATWGKDFLAGKVGIWPGNEGALIGGGITPSFAKQVAATPLPGALSGTCDFAGGDNIAIPRGAKNASGAWEYIQFALQTKEQATLPAAGYTPIRSDVATPQFDAKYPRTAVALHALPNGYAPQTLAYNTAVNQVSGPFFQMFTTAVFGAGVGPALKAAQTGFNRALTQAES